MASYIWMEVTRDKYSLPVAVADTATELARICGVKKDTIHAAISHRKLHKPREEAGTGSYKRYIRVEIEEGKDGRD